MVVLEVPDVTDVTDVLVSSSSMVTELCGGFSCGSDWDFVEPQHCSFSQKKVFILAQMRRKRCGLKNRK